MADISPRRPGRPSLGERVRLVCRIAPELKKAAEQKAMSRGMSENDYLTALIAADTGMDRFESRQGVLPGTM